MSFAEPRFRLNEQQLDDATSVVRVSGEIHVSTAPEFSRLLTEAVSAGRTRIVLDLTDVEFIDSTGLSVLLNALRRVTRAGGRMALVCTNPTVLRLFDISGAGARGGTSWVPSWCVLSGWGETVWAVEAMMPI